jgi:putative transposase
MMRRYTFKLYPNKAQDAALREHARMCAELWNALLEMRETHYRRTKQRGDKKTSLTAFDQGKDLTALRSALPEWAAQPRGTQERVAEMIDLAFKAFFRRAKEGAGASSGYPRFKRVRDRHGAIVADSVHMREPAKSSWSFAPSSAIGRCPPGSKASFSDEAESESPPKSKGYQQATAEYPRIGGDGRHANYDHVSDVTAEYPRIGGDGRVYVPAENVAATAEDPRIGGDGRSQTISSSWRLKMRGVPGQIKARGEFPLAPTSHKTADIRFERGSWWFSICVEMPARRHKGKQSLKVEFDLIDSFATVKSADGQCVPGLSDPFSNGRKSEFPIVNKAQQTGPCGEPENAGEAQASAPATMTPRSCGEPENAGEAQGAVAAFDALQRERDKRFKKFSNRWRKYTKRIAAIKAKDARRRHYQLHVWSTDIARRASELEIIAPPKQALQSGRGSEARPGAEVKAIALLNRHVLNMAPASAIQMLEYKLAETGAPCEMVRRDKHEITVGGVLRAASVAVRKVNRAMKKASL